MMERLLVTSKQYFQMGVQRHNSHSILFSTMQGADATGACSTNTQYSDSEHLQTDTNTGNM
jgi:hypothetical protein